MNTSLLLRNACFFPCWVFLILQAYAAEPTLPERGVSLGDFVPAGYSVAEMTEGDFAHHQRRDIAALLWIAPDSTQPRPFIILMQQPDGSYRLALRTDVFSFDESTCNAGAGNLWCVPGIHTHGSNLVVSTAAGSAAGYHIVEKEFRVISSQWRQVINAEFNRGGDLQCQLSSPRKNEHCFESGVRQNLETGRAITYSQFSSNTSESLRIVRSSRRLRRERLKLLTEVNWQND